MTGYVERGEVPGIVALVSRHGEVQVRSAGRTKNHKEIRRCDS
jgi:hypothetical protein